MIISHITPAGITTLFEQPKPAPPDQEPGDHLQSYPDGPAAGEEAPQTETVEDDDRVMVLSDPISLADIDPATPYVLKDAHDRVVAVENGGAGTSWQWAFVGNYDAYPRDVLPLYFSVDPSKGGATLSVKPGGQSWQLHPRGTATSWEYTYWGGSGYPNTLSLTAKLVKSSPDTFRLIWNNKGTDMNLWADSGSWNWLMVSSSTGTSGQFTLHKFYVRVLKAQILLAQTWPRASFTYASFRTADRYYEAITDAQAKGIWTTSGLSTYSYRSEVFDCDDFSYVYKAEASKTAYKKNAEYGYAVGVMLGAASSTVGHAVNVFIDTSAAVRVIEPQKGGIVAGADWKDRNGVPYEPHFILM
jgi:hypothetical protein